MKLYNCGRMVYEKLHQLWYHVNPIKECFFMFNVRSHGHVYLGNNHACFIEGIGIVHLFVDGTKELFLHNVRYAPRIKKSLRSIG